MNFHGGLGLWWAAESQAPMAERGFADRQLRISDKSRVGKVATY
jgi:hypothetical protein